ncbi:MAG: NADP-dependent 3-hydroxy acid dehydrogenase YdfG [Hydrocarboniphaga sp.]|uniref:oxidoreductase n=1 Tax=Hydrocarboniphaga sp. TaxID=2033016 RepID=UPI00262F6113|nr:oxidoreductase [Hydrocarboniphaga sp.]MDB5971280.1 NADP-dependent 3-hydroxy acid dehydrogenase YdfG [Hydrocarboniphaga sp.]
MDKPGWQMQDMPDQSGRLAIVTGANIGLGYEAALALARRGAKVILACRSMPKAEAAVQRIRIELPKADLQIAELDISDMDSVRHFASEFRREHARLDLLINNAGVMAIPRQLTRDGFEMQLATNHLGHFALTGLLLPCLNAAPHARVVAVSSMAARHASIAFDNLMGERGCRPWKAYNQSKLANLMFGRELQRRLARSGATTTAVIAHPGSATTNLFASPGARIVKQVLMPLASRLLFHAPDRGVLPILFAATSPDAQPGAYYGPDGFQEIKGEVAPACVPKAARDQPAASRLWKVSESLSCVEYLSG